MTVVPDVYYIYVASETSVCLHGKTRDRRENDRLLVTGLLDAARRSTNATQKKWTGQMIQAFWYGVKIYPNEKALNDEAHVGFRRTVRKHLPALLRYARGSQQKRKAVVLAAMDTSCYPFLQRASRRVNGLRSLWRKAVPAPVRSVVWVLLHPLGAARVRKERQAINNAQG